MKVTLVGSVVNLFLIGLKLWVGFAVKSQALIADGVHSLSDLLSDLVAILGLKYSAKEPDEDHPYGHARIQTVSTLIMGIILLAAGGLIVYNAVEAIYIHEPSHPSLLAIAAAAISILLKEWLYWYTIRVGKAARSLLIIGNAWHHRTDALSSVAVLIGVVAVYLNPDWHLADMYAALFVSFFIFKVGGSLFVSAFKEVVDTAPSSETLLLLEREAMEIEGVRQAHDIKARYLGPQLFVEVHIVVDPDISVRKGHAIAKQVERRLIERVDDVERVIIHVDPDPKRD
ncbi:MAG: cation diffusion facilitator family transporter [bacterium]|nr:cation diffusion facilitator family transporter [bacterium]